MIFPTRTFTAWTMSRGELRYCLAQLAELLDSELRGNPDEIIYGVNTLEDARPGEASFLANPLYKNLARNSKASLILSAEIDPSLPKQNFLITPNPSETFQKMLALFGSVSVESGFRGIHPTAVIHPTAEIGEAVEIGPYVVIDQDVKIGAKTKIRAHVFIGASSALGTSCEIHPHVTIREGCSLYDRVILQPGCVIGSCGFGYLPNASGALQKLQQWGSVVLEEDVEIGANTTIDRARFKETRIKKGSKLDNLIQIGHNVEVGEHNVIVAQTGIAGSTKTGPRVMMGGQVGIVGHVTIAPDTKLATRSGVNRSLETGTYRGSPVFPIREYNEQKVHVKRLSKYAKRIEELEKRCAGLEETPSSEKSC